MWTINLDNPQRYNCVVWKYQAGLSEMVLRLYDSENLGDKEGLALIFQGVFYFEGPLKWSGAAFYTATDEECKELLDEIGFEEPNVAVSSGYYRLFKCDLPKSTVRIIAMKVVKVSELPESP